MTIKKVTPGDYIILEYAGNSFVVFEIKSDGISPIRPLIWPDNVAKAVMNLEKGLEINA